MKPPADFPKRQHFVAEMHQKRFVSPDGLLWFYDRRRGVIDSTTPGNLFVEGHLYTLENGEGARFGTIEFMLSRVEAETEPVFERIVQRARQGLRPALSDEQRWALVLYMYLQYRRVPDFIKKVPHEKSVHEQLVEHVDEIEAERGPLSPEAKAAYLDTALAKRLEKNFSALGPVSAWVGFLFMVDDPV